MAFVRMWISYQIQQKLDNNDTCLEEGHTLEQVDRLDLDMVIYIDEIDVIQKREESMFGSGHTIYLR